HWVTKLDAGIRSLGTTAGTGSSGIGSSGSTAGIGSSGISGHRVTWHNRILRLDQFIRLGRDIRLGRHIRLNCGRRGTRLHHGRRVFKMAG
ncbi:unnamed protein product, partial [Staurois parvus]